MGKIKISEGDLLDLLEDHSGWRTGYLDTQTGEILQMLEDSDDEEYERELQRRLDQEPDRYLMIEPIDSRDGFRMMERFVETLPECENRRLLEKALSWKKPFSNFRDALTEMGELRRKWFEFHDAELRRFALDWLEVKEIDAKLTSHPKFIQ